MVSREKTSQAHLLVLGEELGEEKATDRGTGHTKGEGSRGKHEVRAEADL